MGRDAHRPPSAAFLGAALGRLASPMALLRRPLGTSVWLLQLRWFAVLGQLITIAVVRWGYGVPLPMGPLLLLVGFTAATNILWGSWLFVKAPPRGGAPQEAAVTYGDGYRPRLAPLLLMADLLVLSAMLYLTGGGNNPFVFFYFVNLAVGGMILSPPWAWTLAAVAILTYGLLLVHYRPLPVLDVTPFGGGQLRREGFFVAFTACASVITYFVTRLSDELTRRQAELRETQRQRDRSLRLEGLATLAAGAAHELASPLATIAVAAGEMARHLNASGAPDQVQTDVRLIDSELQHCRQILARMRSAAGDRSAERWDQTTVGDLVDAILEGLRDPNRVDVVMSEEIEEQPLWLPRQSVAQAVRNLLQNALDASPAGAPIQLQATVGSAECQLVVRDRGSGMADDILHRTGEPFFTTKPPGRGMGLGLFLTRNVISRLGGQLEMESELGVGTTVTVVLPRRPGRLKETSEPETERPGAPETQPL